MSCSDLPDAQPASFWRLGSTPPPIKTLVGGDLTVSRLSGILRSMNSLLQTGSGMLLARVGRDRPGSAEKRFLITRRGLLKSDFLAIYLCRWLRPMSSWRAWRR